MSFGKPDERLIAHIQAFVDEENEGRDQYHKWRIYTPEQPTIFDDPNIRIEGHDDQMHFLFYVGNALQEQGMPPDRIADRLWTVAKNRCRNPTVRHGQCVLVAWATTPLPGSDGTVAPLAGVTLGTMIDTPVEEPRLVSPWLLCEGRTTLFPGREKSGKTTLAIQDAAAAAKHGKVVWVNCEMQIDDVLRYFTAVDPGYPENVVVTERWPTTWEEVEALLIRHDPRAVYLDSLTSFLGQVEGKVPDHSDTEKWAGLMMRFLRWPGAKCLLAHANKSDDEYKGNTAIASSVDIIRTMKTPDARSSGRMLHTSGRMPPWPRLQAFSWDGTRYAADDAAARKTRTAGKRDLLADVRAWFEMNHEPIGTEALRESLHCGKARLREVLERLADEGLLRQTDDGQWAARL